MTILGWIAIGIVILTIAALVKRWETRLVLFTSGLFIPTNGSIQCFCQFNDKRRINYRHLYVHGFCHGI